MDAVNDVLSKVMSSLGLERRLREHTLASLWPTFVSGAVADRSRPLFIDNERQLVVSVANAATGQELSMLKTKILSKLIPAARSLGIEIRGIRLDMKYYRAIADDTAVAMPETKPLAGPDDEQMDAVQLTEAENQQLKQLREDLFQKTTDDEIKTPVKEKILRLFEIELRLRRWRLENGFPACHQCGNPADRLHQRRSSKGNQPGYCLACIYVE
jgi:hypothetical protein